MHFAIVLPVFQQKRIMLGLRAPPRIVRTLGDLPHHAGEKTSAPVGPALAAVLPPSVGRVDGKEVGVALDRCPDLSGGEFKCALQPRAKSREINRGRSGHGEFAHHDLIAKGERDYRFPARMLPYKGGAIGSSHRHRLLNAREITNAAATSRLLYVTSAVWGMYKLAVFLPNQIRRDQENRKIDTHPMLGKQQVGNLEGPFSR
jgi:hypothetical protein